MTQTLLQTDCLNGLREYPDAHFTAACFGPPYGSRKDSVFNVLRDFGPEGKFIEYAREISRVSVVWAVNLTQHVYKGRNLPYFEQLVMTLEALGVQLWDRWTVLKVAAQPSRGERALTLSENVLLFSQYPERVHTLSWGGWRTDISVSHHGRNVGSRPDSLPYHEAIPRQVFEMYGHGGPVLDPFVGTGTSLVVAQSLGIPGVGFDVDADILSHARQRLKRD